MPSLPNKSIKGAAFKKWVVESIDKLIDFHMKSGTIGTFTGVRMPSRFGTVRTDENESVYVDTHDVWEDLDEVGIKIAPGALRLTKK